MNRGLIRTEEFKRSRLWEQGFFNGIVTFIDDENYFYQEKEMSRYIITYLGGNQPTSSEESKQHMTKYMEWLSSLGASAVSPANPLKNTSTVNPDGTITPGGATSMSGYTIIEADSMDAALSIAKECPFLDIGGSLEVSELIRMPG